MTNLSENYHIRPARVDEVDRIRHIEDEANILFSGLGLIDESLDEGVPIENLDRLIRLGQVWVTCSHDDEPIGVVIASEMDGTIYIEEMDVLPEYGRRGIGARLLEYVCNWAGQQGYPTLTLSTFRDVPWNGPFYRKHGFEDLKDLDWTPGMHSIRKKELEHGLRVEARVFMIRDVK